MRRFDLIYYNCTLRKPRQLQRSLQMARDLLHQSAYSIVVRTRFTPKFRGGFDHRYWLSMLEIDYCPAHVLDR